MPSLSRVATKLAMLAQGDTNVGAQIEMICKLVAAELHRQNLSDNASSFLLEHCPSIMDKIQDTQLKNTHFMEE